MPLNGPTDAIAMFAAAAVVELAGSLSRSGLIDDATIRHLHAFLDLAEKAAERAGDPDYAATILALRQSMPRPTPEPRGTGPAPDEGPAGG